MPRVLTLLSCSTSLQQHSRQDIGSIHAGWEEDAQNAQNAVVNSFA